jgi:NAD(P)-dependent dehydrogenase (short-subunit alcohol dehydrogenase family)
MVLTSSVVATLGVPGRVAYAASKGAVQALTLAMAADSVRPQVGCSSRNGWISAAAEPNTQLSTITSSR